MDSPDEAASEYCRLDGAEEFCVAASDGLNAFRAELPFVPALAEVNQQLEIEHPRELDQENPPS